MPPRAISIYKATQLLAKEVARIDVPDLGPRWEPDDNRFFYQGMDFLNAIVDAIKAGRIRVLDEFSLLPIPYHKDMPYTQLIRWDDLQRFAADHCFDLTAGEQSGAEPHQAPAAREVPDGADPNLPEGAPPSEATPWDEPGLSRRERQIRVIEALADEFGYERLAIPSGGKKAIGDACRAKHKNLFGSGGDPFKEAWQAALNRSRIKTEKHDTYSKR